jgi:hypothetical protein
MMKLSKELLAIIGRTNPAIYDVVFPHGPLGRFGAVALNPQPLPPRAFGAAMAVEFARNVAMSERFGLPSKALFDELDDWCPTKPRKIKLPKGWPWPPPEPEPGPDWLVGLHLGFASQLAVLGASFSKNEAGKMIDAALDRSVAAMDAAIG